MRVEDREGMFPVPTAQANTTRRRRWSWAHEVTTLDVPCIGTPIALGRIIAAMLAAGAESVRVDVRDWCYRFTADKFMGDDDGCKAWARAIEQALYQEIVLIRVGR